MSKTVPVKYGRVFPSLGQNCTNKILMSLSLLVTDNNGIALPDAERRHSRGDGVVGGRAARRPAPGQGRG